MTSPKIPLELLGRLNSSSHKLLFELSELMTDDMLRQIAKANYGYREEECFAILKEIVSSKQEVKTVDYEIRDVLELARWIQPKTIDDHTTRAFTSAFVLIINPTCPIGDLDESGTLAILIESITVINKCQKSAQELIVWRILLDYNKELKLYLDDEEDQHLIDTIDFDISFISSLIHLMKYNKENQEDINEVENWLKLL